MFSILCEVGRENKRDCLKIYSKAILKVEYTVLSKPPPSYTFGGFACLFFGRTAWLAVVPRPGSEPRPQQ